MPRKAKNATVNKAALTDFVKQQTMTVYLVGYIAGRYGIAFEEGDANEHAVKDATDSVTTSLIPQLPFISAYVCAILRAMEHTEDDIAKIYSALQ